jgi:hypothetical protein
MSSFELPNLNTLSAQQLVDELVRRIPFIVPDWTDHNDSDPGITLLQLLAWMTQTLTYQANAVPGVTYLNMVRWLLGLAFGSDINSDEQPYVPPAAIDASTMDPGFSTLQSVLLQIEGQRSFEFSSLRDAVVQFRVNHPYLAVTGPDIEALALESNLAVLAMEQQDERNAARERARGTYGHIQTDAAGNLLVRRACVQYEQDAVNLYIVSDEQWDYALTNEKSPPNTVSLERQSSADDDSQQWQQLLTGVMTYVSQRALLGSPILVKRATLALIDVECEVRCFARERLTSIAQSVANAVRDCLQPCRSDGGSDWDYGAMPNRSWLLPLVKRVPGVIDVLDIRITVPLSVGLPLLRKVTVTATGVGFTS